MTNDENGKNALHVTRPQNKTPNYKYTVQAADSVVVDWEPDINFAGSIWNANDIEQNSYQRFTGDEQKFVMQQENTERFQERFDEPTAPLIKSTPEHENAEDLVYLGATNMPDSVTGSSIRSRTAASHSPYAGINPILNSHLQSWMSSWNAKLTILGDPEIMPTLQDGSMNLCEVEVFYPVNYNNENFAPAQKHYSSGVYVIEAVTHVIRAGSYLTILDLTRANAAIPEPVETDQG